MSRWERVELGTSMSGDITGENNLAVVVQWAVVVQVWCRLARGRILTKFLIRNTRLCWSFLPLIKYKSKAKISKSWNKFSHCREFFCVTLLARSCNESPTRKRLNCKNKKEELVRVGSALKPNDPLVSSLSPEPQECNNAGYYFPSVPFVRQPVTYSIEKMLFLPSPAVWETFAAAKGEGKGVGLGSPGSSRNHISRRSMRD